MIEPILIQKDPERSELLPYKDKDYQRLVDEVDLHDLTRHIISLNVESWVPSCYWENVGKSIDVEIWYGEISWAIYSYLVDKGFLIIEDQYYRYNTSRSDKYKKRNSYFNTLEKELYHPIRDRLLDGSYLDISRVVEHTYTRGYYYKIGKSYLRENKLNKII